MGLFQGKMIGNIIEKAGGVALKGIGMFAGDKKERDQQDTTRYGGTIDLQKAQLAASGDTWFDIIINGYGRLPRPVILTGACFYVVWVGINSTGPLDFANNLSAAPVWFTFIISTILLYPFGSRPIEKHFTKKYNHQRADKLAEQSSMQASPTPDGNTTDTRPSSANKRSGGFSKKNTKANKNTAGKTDNKAINAIMDEAQKREK